jgi:hypothetical protein
MSLIRLVAIPSCWDVGSSIIANTDVSLDCTWILSVGTNSIPFPMDGPPWGIGALTSYSH